MIVCTVRRRKAPFIVEVPVLLVLPACQQVFIEFLAIPRQQSPSLPSVGLRTEMEEEEVVEKINKPSLLHRSGGYRMAKVNTHGLIG